jgi:hypothetical protein
VIGPVHATNPLHSPGCDATVVPLNAASRQANGPARPLCRHRHARPQTGVLYRNVIRFSSPRVAFSGARGYVSTLPGMRFAPDIRAEPYARTVPDPFDEQ